MNIYYMTNNYLYYIFITCLILTITYSNKIKTNQYINNILNNFNGNLFLIILIIIFFFNKSILSFIVSLLLLITYFELRKNNFIIKKNYTINRNKQNNTKRCFDLCKYKIKYKKISPVNKAFETKKLK